MRRAGILAMLALVAACRNKGEATAQRADASSIAPSISAPASAPPSERGPAIVAEACLSCHSEEMLRQQRLTPPQWEKVVKKMAGWGANLTDDDVPVASAYLAANYGPDAGAYRVATILATMAVREIAPQSDSRLGDGGADRGAELYAARCASCHGADARGQIGVNLVDRPLLYRADDFAATIRTGRAKMPAQPATSDGEIADLLAHLRRLHAAR